MLPWPEPRSGARRRATTYRDEGPETRWLDEWRDEPAYVLLGDPGAGKSFSFSSEASAAGTQVIPARYVQSGTARLPPPGSTVFIDGLDEVRGGSADGLDALGSIVAWLRQSGSPRFRLSCREADWFGDRDREWLKQAVPGGRVTVLHLEPLTRLDVAHLLEQLPEKVPNPEAFWQAAEQHGVTPLFKNPLLLLLMVRAVSASGGQWPRTRRALYDAACRQLAEEVSEEHRLRSRVAPVRTDRILQQAGILSAVLLLSGRTAIAVRGMAGPDDVELHDLPDELDLEHALPALTSKVFTVENGRAAPRHRTIAEFLAAKSVAACVIDRGLPLGRVLALLVGFDGRPVESHRGLLGWLIVHLNGPERERLLRLDPLGFILNGDAAVLNHQERLCLLAGLEGAAHENPWFRANQWVSHPFGPLATRDMEQDLLALLQQSDRCQAHQVFLDCVFDALVHGEIMPMLAPAMASWVTDLTAYDVNRLGAFKAWMRHCPAEERGPQLLAWLHGFDAGAIEDADDRVLGTLLTHAYPDVVGPVEILRYLKSSRRRHVIGGEYDIFWSDRLLRLTPDDCICRLADAWVARFPDGLSDEFKHDVRPVALRLLARALETAGAQITIERLYSWLGIGLDRHGTDHVIFEDRLPVISWLTARPDLMRAVVAYGYSQQRSDRRGRRAFWEAEGRLRGAPLASHLPGWLMELALASPDEDFAAWAVRRVAHIVADPPPHAVLPTVDEVASWVGLIAHRFPAAGDWLSLAWTSELEDWRGEQYRRALRDDQKHALEDQRRRETFALGDGPPSPWLLSQVALAYDDYSRLAVRGDTPEARVEDLLRAGPQAAAHALAAIDATLQRHDLPDADAILQLHAQRRTYFIGLAALLAARRAFDRDATCWTAWPEALQKTLFAFWLSDGTGDEPGWCRALGRHVPERVAQVLVRYAVPKLREATGVVNGLSHLAKDDELEPLVRLVLPQLLDRFPTRCSVPARRLLCSLLSALSRLDRVEAVSIVRRKLAHPALDVGQRVAWLVAGLSFDDAGIGPLERLVKHRSQRAVILGEALHDQGILQCSNLSVRAVHALINLLAPITLYKPQWRGGIVTAARERETTIKHLFDRLGTSPGVEAREALRALVNADHLASWRTVAQYQVQAQRSIHRESTFSMPAPAAVGRVLACAAPAHIGDLMALFIHHLSDIEQEIRGSPSFLLRYFWRDDGNPQREERCRDLLLDKLKPLLARQQVDLTSESRAAADKRADLRAVFMDSALGRLALPIEIKLDDHTAVWTAWADQLQQLYAIEPEASQHGLYLVLWFGRDTRASPQGVRPASAQEFRTQIASLIPESDRQRLAVFVMDLSWPATAKRR